MISRIALITGATGFVGSHLAESLVKKNYLVHAVVRPNSDIAFLKTLDRKYIRIHVYENHNFQQIFSEISKNERPEIVFHLASMVLGAHTYNDIPALVQSNITFGMELLECMKDYGICRLVNTGTSWQHYDNEPYNPVNLYAATKQAFQDIEVYYEKACSFKIINLQLFDNYGPNDRRKKLLNLLKQTVKTNTTLNMTPGEQLIDLVHISDLVQAFIMAGEYLLNNEYEYCGTYSISSGNPITLRTLVEVIQEMTGKKVNIRWGGQNYRDREVMVPWSNGTVLPGWYPRVDLKMGLTDFFMESDRLMV